MLSYNRMPTFIKDTIPFLQKKKIDELTFTDKSILVAINIEALYSSIPNEKGLDLLSRVLQLGSP